MIFRIIRRFVIYPLLIVGLLCALVIGVYNSQTAEAAVKDPNTGGGTINPDKLDYNNYWEENADDPQFVVHFVTDGGTEVADLPVRCINTDAIGVGLFKNFVKAKRTAPQKENYTYDGWYLGGGPNETIRPRHENCIDIAQIPDVNSRTEDLILHAHWTATTTDLCLYLVSNGVTSLWQTIQVEYDTTPTLDELPAPPTQNACVLAHDGWCINATCEGECTLYNEENFSDAHVVQITPYKQYYALYAHYSELTFSVTYKWTNENGVVKEHVESVVAGEAAPNYNPYADAGKLDGWYLDQTFEMRYSDHETPVRSDITLYAKEVRPHVNCYWPMQSNAAFYTQVSLSFGEVLPKLKMPSDVMTANPNALYCEWYYDEARTQKYNGDPITSKWTYLYGKAVTKYDLLTEFVPVLHNESAGTHSAGNFAFENDVAVAKDNPSQLVFRLKLNNPNNAEFSTSTNKTYNFQIVRENASGQSALVYIFQARHYASDGWTFSHYSNFVKGEKVQMLTTLIEAELNGWEYSATVKVNDKQSFPSLLWKLETFDGYKYLTNSLKTTYLPFIHEEADGSKYVYLTIDTANTTDRYSVIFDQGGTKLRSYSASVYDVVNSLNDRNALEDNFGDKLDDANNVLASTTKTIVVKFLQNIPNTNFATSVTKSVDVVVDGSGEVQASAVAAALGVKNFDALGSPCIGFEFDASAQTYVAKYLKNVWLSAKTVDGKSANYFLDCNLSYADYYGRLVKDGVFSQDLYDFVYAQIINTAPYYLAGYKPNELHGYWGYVVIPNTYTLDALWAELFNTETSFDGVVTNFEYTELLSMKAYDKLLTEYDYTWIGHAWNDTAAFISGSASANHYIFYAEIDTHEAEIGENGGGDGGAIKNDVKKLPNKILNGLEKMFSWWDNRSKSTKTLVYVLIGVAALLCVGLGIVYAVTKKKE